MTLKCNKNYISEVQLAFLLKAKSLGGAIPKSGKLQGRPWSFHKMKAIILNFFFPSRCHLTRIENKDTAKKKRGGKKKRERDERRKQSGMEEGESEVRRPWGVHRRNLTRGDPPPSQEVWTHSKCLLKTCCNFSFSSERERIPKTFPWSVDKMGGGSKISGNSVSINGRALVPFYTGLNENHMFHKHRSTFLTHNSQLAVEIP